MIVPLSFLASAITVFAAVTAAPPLAAAPPIEAALARWDMAEVRALAKAMPKGAERCAVEGVIANRDNRLDVAARSLPHCLAVLERTGSPRAQQAFETLLDTYRRRGAFGKEYALIARWLGAHAEHMESDAVADLRDELGMAGVLRNLPGPRATGSRTAILHSYRNVLGTHNVDLTVGGVTLSWNIDTGANYSVVSDSAARRMHLAVRDVPLRAVGLTGHSVRTRIAVIDSLPVGAVLLRHMVTIVVPDEALHIRSPRADYQIEAILGCPALAQLGRFRIDADGTFAIDRDGPLLTSGATLYMNQLTPLAEVEIAGRKGLVSIDTGANRSSLYASYATRFADRAPLWSRKRDTTLGLGGGTEGDVAIEPHLTITAGAATVIERDVAVTLEGDKAAPVLGNLGQPALTAKGSYTFDFRSMRLLLGAEASNG
ncbi:Predicted aspartyl protease [Sphingomonas sp. NFR04]|uniref:aspartyl protease family protein n=1 Tax=Sphingomonas sp. NFR04 TaxID=1566283 RepID=UPI0008F1B541|nr:aspartyl protease family protein [Sphingomonas sp. NFR04]SFJ08924.1 Predicted aspartyl protease [Sphingomonas sp. NFR04]